jgi:hypothetical protein
MPLPHRLALFSTISFIAITSNAYAQDTRPAVNSEKRIYRIEDFAQFNPVTALDMVSRVPGFSIEGSEGRRGFGENAGNVLIDGDRPSTKTDDISAILSRIPASQVDYLELTEQAGADGEAQGKGQVVNVVRKVSNKLSGTYDASLLKGRGNLITPFGSVSATLKRGATTYEANASVFWEKPGAKGPEDFLNGSRQLIERRTYVNKPEYKQASVGGAIKTRIGATKLNLNASLTLNDGNEDRFGVITGPTGARIGDELLATEAPISDYSYEVGGDVEFKLAKTLTSKMVALYKQSEEEQASIITTNRTGRPTNVFDTRFTGKPSEAILRLQNDWNGINKHTIQFGAEVAKNRLDARFTAASNTAGVATSFPASRVLVRESRFEPFISDTWSASPTLKIESGVIFEFSTLRLSGDSTAKRSFTFAKPRAIATWTPNKTTTFELKTDYQVSQLDFNDFATSVDVGAGNQVDAGNADLVPEKVSSFSGLVRKKFMDRGSIQFEAEYQWVKDTIDLIPISTLNAQGQVVSRFDGTGNIGNSKRWNLEMEVTLPFAWLGIKGMELKYVGHYHGSRVTDPVTGLNRRMSNRPEWHVNYDLRHDIGKTGISYGFGYGTAAPIESYFVNQYRWQDNRDSVSAFIEYSKLKIGTLKLQAFNLTGSGFNRQRFLYSDLRGNSPVTDLIIRERRENTGVQLSLSGKF